MAVMTMPKYMLMLNAEEHSKDQMANSTREQMQASMAEWIAWKDEAEQTITFQFGNPLQAATRITREGEEDSPNPAAGYAMIDAESQDQAVGVLRNHPHLKRDGATIDLLEFVTMPGIRHADTGE